MTKQEIFVTARSSAFRHGVFLLLALLLLQVYSVQGLVSLSSPSTKPSITTSLFMSSSPQEDSVPSAASSRRHLLQTVAAASLATFATSRAAVADSNNIDVYFGCGCFWHVQHEFVQAERNLLGRSEMQVTARAGYAGGTAGSDANGRVCYHNAAMIADYGSLGHAEVVQVSIPPDAFPQFVTEYCNLFNDQGYRPDQFQDKGGEYRNLVGLPGGVDSPYAKQLIDASRKAGDKLDYAKGKGDDPDRRALVFVMDTANFPFYVAEQYHQFHDGFNLGENYPGSYNDLAGKLAKKGTLGESKCPNGLLGLGALGL